MTEATIPVLPNSAAIFCDFFNIFFYRTKKKIRVGTKIVGRVGLPEPHIFFVLALFHGMDSMKEQRFGIVSRAFMFTKFCKRLHEFHKSKQLFLHTIHHHNHIWEPSCWVLDSRPSGCGFKPHRRHYVVSLSKNINPSFVLVQSRMARPFITERLLMGLKESNQTKQKS